MSVTSLFAQTPNDMYAIDTANVSTNAVMAGIFTFLVIFMVIAYIITSILLARIFKKAGVASWKAWVPVYNTWTTLELGDQKGWWALLWLAPMLTWLPMDTNSPAFITLYLITLLVSMVGAVFLYIAMYKIGLRFGKEGYFVLWAIFLPLVWYAWLAFDDSTWKKKAPSTAVGTPSDSSEE